MGTIKSGPRRNTHWCWPVYSYRKGQIPIVISVPHNGNLRPDFMKNRTACMKNDIKHTRRNKDKCKIGTECENRDGSKKTTYTHSDNSTAVRRACGLAAGDSFTALAGDALYKAIKAKAGGKAP